MSDQIITTEENEAAIAQVSTENVTGRPDEANPQITGAAEIEPKNAGETPAHSPADNAERLEKIKKLLDQDRAGKSETDLRAFTPFLIRTSNDDFEGYLQDGSLRLLQAVIDELANAANIRANIRKVGAVKKRFDALMRDEQKKLRDEEKEKAEAAALPTSIIEKRNQLADLRRRFTASLDTFNKRKADLDVQEVRQKEVNTEQKKKLLDELKEIVMSEDATAFDAVQKIQEEWRKIGPVTQELNEDFYQSYRMYVSQFYQMRGRYLEFAQQVRKINQQEKERLIQQLNEVLPQADADLNLVRWQDTSTKVNALFEQWKAVGAVPRAKSDELWNKFKEGLDRFYQMRRAFYNSMDKTRAENAARKESVLQELTMYRNFDSTDVEAWRNATVDIQKLRDEFRTVGSAPLSRNKELREQFVATLREFFERKKKFFGTLENELSDVVKKKEELLRQADELKDSEEWREVARKLQELQQEWRDLGQDFTKDLRKLNKRFRKACDSFFRRRGLATEQLREAEVKNLERKTAICDRLEAILAEAEPASFREEATKLREEFDELGPGPREQNRKANDRFRALFNKYVDKYFEAGEKDKAKYQARAAAPRNRNDRGGDRDGGYGGDRNRDRDRDRGGDRDGGPMREDKKFIKKLRSLEDKIQQYETNIEFISKGSKSSELRKEIEARIEEAKQQKAALERRIRAASEPKAPRNAESKEKTAPEATVEESGEPDTE